LVHCHAARAHGVVEDPKIRRSEAEAKSNKPGWRHRASRTRIGASAAAGLSAAYRRSENPRCKQLVSKCCLHLGFSDCLTREARGGGREPQTSDLRIFDSST